METAALGGAEPDRFKWDGESMPLPLRSEAGWGLAHNILRFV